jgi:putative inorganic carbon (HCO3(-)) transporter
MLNVNSIYLTNSRGALLGLLTTATVYLLLRFGRRGIAVCLVFALVGIALSPSRLSEINSDESSAHERVWTWERGLQLLEENPVFGIGKGEFAYKGGTDLIAHNNFVQVFAETGLFGFFLWMGAIWVSIKGLLLGWWRTRQDPESEENRLSMVLVSLLAGFFATTFFVVVENELLYVLFAIWSAGVVNIGRTIPDFDEPKFERLDMAITFAGMICVISAVWVAAVVELI